MGRRDNRRSMKMRRRTRQRKLKARLLRKRGTTRSKPAAGKQPKKKSSGGKE